MLENTKNFETISAFTETNFNLKNRNRFINNKQNSKFSSFLSYISKFNKSNKMPLHKNYFLSTSPTSNKSHLLLLEKNKDSKFNSINNEHKIKIRRNIKNKYFCSLCKSNSIPAIKKNSDSIKNFVLAPKSFRKPKNFYYNSTQNIHTNKVSSNDIFSCKKEKKTTKNLKSKSDKHFKIKQNRFLAKNEKNNENLANNKIYGKTLELIKNPYSIFYLIHENFMEQKHYRNNSSRINIKKKFSDYKMEISKMEQNAFLEVYNLKKQRLVGNEIKFKNIGISKNNK